MRAKLLNSTVILSILIIPSIVFGSNFYQKDIRAIDSAIQYTKGPFILKEDKFNELYKTHYFAPTEPISKQQDNAEIEEQPQDYYVKKENGLLRLLSSKDKKQEEETVLQRIKPNQDGRTRIQNTEDLKYRFHGHMIMEFINGKKYLGSGALVGPHHVLTAGHNIYSHKQYKNKDLGWAVHVTFIPAQNEDKEPFGQVESSILLAHKDWIDGESKQARKDFDLAMIILEKAIGYQTGWAGLLCAPDDTISKFIINVTGYPGDKGKKGKKSTEMWTMSHTSKSLTSNAILYDIDTYRGQSGSGVWTELSNDPGFYVLGVHAYGVKEIDSTYPASQSNQGTRLSYDKINIVLSWLRDYQLNEMIEKEKNNPRNILAELKQVVRKQKDKDAQYKLANRYLFKNPFFKEFEYIEGIYYYDQNTRQRSYFNNAEVKRRTLINSDSKNGYKAFKLYKKAAHQDHLEALWMIGECYDLGFGTNPNPIKAAIYYQKAASQNHSKAQYSLGVFYEGAQPPVQNFKAAENWYRKAAAQENANAQFALGNLYNNGRGVDQDYVKAREEYQMAAGQGHSSAQVELGLLYYYGQGVSQSDENAKIWYEMAAEQNNVDAQFRLGLYYHTAPQSERDYKKAREYYEKAATQDDSRAQYRLGELYFWGHGGNRNYVKARQLYKMAAVQNNVNAQYELGRLYYLGRGVDQNYGKAKVCFKKAAVQNHPNALEHLKKIDIEIQQINRSDEWH